MPWRGQKRAFRWLEKLQAKGQDACALLWLRPRGPSRAPGPPAPHTFGAVPGGRAVALGFALLRGGGPQSLCALAGRLARVAGAAHGPLLLPEAALCGALRGAAAEPRPRQPGASPAPAPRPRGRRPTSPHSPATQRAGGQRRKLQRMVAGGLAAGGQCAGGSVARWSALLHRTTRWRRPGPQLGVHCSRRGGFVLAGAAVAARPGVGGMVVRREARGVQLTSARSGGGALGPALVTAQRRLGGHPSPYLPPRG